MGDYLVKEFALRGLNLSLAVAPEDSFIPNATTVRFSRAIPEVKDKVVFDIGTGVCPLGIWAGILGAREVHCVDPHEAHIALAQRNVRSYSLENVVHIYHGRFFSPFEENGAKADIIIGDVSGIADIASRALGWYPPSIPTGGHDGTENLVALIEQAPCFLADKGVLYFPAALDLSDHARIMEAATWCFESVAPLFKKPARFPLTGEQVRRLHDGYNGDMPQFITLQEKRKGYFWRGQMYAASMPRNRKSV
jgi:hypothetical protein